MSNVCKPAASWKISVGIIFKDCNNSDVAPSVDIVHKLKNDYYNKRYLMCHN